MESRDKRSDAVAKFKSHCNIQEYGKQRNCKGYKRVASYILAHRSPYALLSNKIQAGIWKFFLDFLKDPIALFAFDLQHQTFDFRCQIRLIGGLNLSDARVAC